MGIKHTITFTGLTITLAELRGFIDDADDAGISDSEQVSIKVSPTTNSPTDRGGEIHISVTG